MDILLKFIGGAFGLIALYLIVSNANSVNTVFNSFATGSSQIFRTLQARG